MDVKNAKIRINLSQAEIEIEGSEEFVEKHLMKVEDYLQLSNTIISSKPGVNGNQSSDDPHTTILKKSEDSNKQLPEIFGEWIHKLPTNAIDQIKVLFAGYYIQKHSGEGNCFSASAANQVLKEHGIKIANVSTTIKRLTDAKRIFQIGKVEGFNNYRLTRESEQEIITLLLE